MTNQEILKHVDHTLLKPEATWEDIKTICDEAVEAGTASICINPAFVGRAAKYLDGKISVCTVIGFPLGATSTKAKVEELKVALADGAEEFDMVINIGELKAKNYSYVENEIKALKAEIPDKVLKVIIETCLLTEEEKIKMCEIVVEAGADYIKTSTGFSTGGATFEDIKLFADNVKDKCKIKAAGGIKTREDMLKFLSLGADRLGTSSALKILKNEQTTGY